MAWLFLGIYRHILKDRIYRYFICKLSLRLIPHNIYYFQNESSKVMHMSYIHEWWICHNFQFRSLSFSFQPYDIWRWYIISCHVLTGRELFSYGKFWNRQMNLSKPYERSHPKKYDALTEKREKYILLNVKR